ncbi:hypothetical protein [Martelella sp. FOR1707]
MVDVVPFVQSDMDLVRREAARIRKMRRRLTRERALIAFDQNVVRGGMLAGMRRGAAITRADALGDALRARLAELDELAKERAPSATIHHLERLTA